MKLALAGLVFGLAIGFLMRAPGWDAVIPAYAINLCVMAALWLGIAIGADKLDGRGKADIAAAVATFVLAAIALRTTPWLMVPGFAFQAWWSGRHRAGGLGMRGPDWFSTFAAAANVGFALSLTTLLALAP